MRKILLLFFLTLTSGLIFSQSEENLNFKIEENEIFWQKVIEIDSTKDKYIEVLKLKEFYNNLDWNENSIAGKSNKKDLKIKSPYWASFPFECFIKVEFKESRCRFTFTNITFDGPEIEVYGVKQKYDYKLSEQAQKDGKFINSKKILNILSELNEFFENIISKKQIHTNTDW